MKQVLKELISSFRDDLRQHLILQLFYIIFLLRLKYVLCLFSLFDFISYYFIIFLQFSALN